MNVGDTRYGDACTPYDAKTPLNSFGTSLGDLAEQAAYETHYQLKPSLLQAGFSGAATQLVTYSIIC